MSTAYHPPAEYWHETLPNSRIVVLPGQQHIAMDTAPDLFVHTVLLQKISVSDSLRRSIIRT
jgi:pimeloyl-ACP methyl ester carboxylesterase